MENKTSLNVPVKTKWKEFLENGWDLLKFAIVALIIVLPIRMWIAQPFVVSGESMYPTFDNGQYLIIDEISYILGNAQRGDVVVFRYPNDTKRFFIKRVIGLPNEKIIVNNGEVTIINKEHPDGFKMVEPYINEKFFTGSTYETKDNEYFVMGDNRNRSSDSRFWGILPKNLMIGKVFLRLLPIKTMSYMPGKYNQ
ncbi:MAG: signal peptidase I [Candidatus Paceibacterota bacterium]|jgi:signal peptidase I